ncbi:hypothetical protein GCM10027445_46500 [Amycolatopsis endophytica]|uniref:Bifunctional isochorismate lyase/aryl carrier protein n=1 Tax=Amycolatopsis endophytica TaxID=860233 RepID=A0A853BCS4_9PSEU|nr:phosphopantetheine-binding protein [Amycolatopsis endophytica]NYI92532.1 bifunctional isochorismate lyase/aryl carrier protein [Amycolatopsis endophytica]
MGASGALTLEEIRADVVEVLELDGEEVTDDEDLIDVGMDSIRVMHLVAKWRAAGADVDLVRLAEDPTITGWYRLLGAG